MATHLQRTHRPNPALHGRGPPPQSLPPLSLLLMVLHLAALAAANDADKLLQFKATFSNGKAVLSSWRAGTDPCSGGWLGVACEGGKVADIILVSKGLRGSIPPAGYDLPSSVYQLDLKDNQIAGPLPSDWSWLPSRIIDVFFEANSLTGSLPAEFKVPNTLEVFSVAYNALNGSLPAAWDLPRDLVELWLNNNKLSGSLPAWTMPAKTQVYVQPGNDDLCGAVPAGARFYSYDSRTNNASIVASLPSCSLPASPSEGPSSAPASPAVPAESRPPTDSPSPSPSPSLGEQSASPAPATPSSPPAPVPPSAPAGNTTAPGSTDGNTTSTDSDSGSNVGVIAGAVAGAVIGVALAGLVGWWCWRRRRQQAAPHMDEEAEDLEKVPSKAAAAAGAGGGYSNGKPPPAPSYPPGTGSGPSAPPLPPPTPLGSAGGVAVVAAASSGSAGGDEVEEGDDEEGPVEHPAAPAAASRGTAALLSNDVVLSAIVTKLSSPFGAVAARAASGSAADSAVGAVPFRAGQEEVGEEEGERSAAQQAAAAPSKRPSVGEALRVDVKAWMIKFQDLELDYLVGEGSFGRVYLGRWRETPVAVKLLLGAGAGSNPAAAVDQALSLSNPVLAALQEEASLLAALRHPNVLNFLGMCTTPPCVVTEFCPRGSLFDILRNARTSPDIQRRLSWRRRLLMAEDAAKGMLYLHEHDPTLIHRDLKSPNLLVSASWKVKVCDFGLTRIMQSEGLGSTVSSTGVTNPRWLAPEVLAGVRPSKASDVFAFGTILWEMMTWQMPWADEPNIWQVVKYVMDGGRLHIPSPADLPAGSGRWEGLAEYVALISRCWAQEPAERPSFTEIIADLRALMATTGSSGRPLARPTSTPGAARPPGDANKARAAGSGGSAAAPPTPTDGSDNAAAVGRVRM